MIARLAHWVRSRREQERGAVLILTAVSMVVLLAAGAMGVDLGFSVVGSRSAQAIADAAAQDLIQYINAADQQTTMTGVQNYLDTVLPDVDTDNGSSAKLTVTPLLYQSGKYTVPSAGCQDTEPFNPAVPVCNAVAVQATQTVPQPFWGGFTSLAGKSGSGLPPGSGCGSGGSGGCGSGCNNSACFSCPSGGCTSCPTTACAVWAAQACFSIGTYLATVNTQQTGVLNAILSQLGTSANVSAVGYEGLNNTYVSMSQLITASGTVLNSSDVMTTSLTPAQWLAIFTDAVNNQTSAGTCSTGETTEQSNAETALASLTFGSSTPVELCQLVSVNGVNCNSGNNTLTYADLSAGVNVLQVLTTEAELANGGSGFNITSALGITGVTNATLTLSSIQPPQVAFGPVGSYTSSSPCPATTGTSTCAETSQVTADLSLAVQGDGTLNIPLSAADGSATFLSIGCQNNVMSTAKIYASTVAATAAVTLSGTGIATLTVSAASQTAEAYSPSVVPPTTTTMTATPSPTNPKQLGSTSPTLSYSGLSASSPVYTLLTSTLPGVYGPIMQAAGVNIGGADVAYLGSDCDSIELAA